MDEKKRTKMSELEELTLTTPFKRRGAGPVSLRRRPLKRYPVRPAPFSAMSPERPRLPCLCCAG